MKSLQLIDVALSVCLAVFALGYRLTARSRSHVVSRVNDSAADGEIARVRASRLAAPAISSYRLDASQSKFVAHAFAGGVFWFQGRDYLGAGGGFFRGGRVFSVSPPAFSLGAGGPTAAGG